MTENAVAPSVTVGDVRVTAVVEWEGDFMPRSALVPDSVRGEWDRERGWLVPSFWDDATDVARLRSQSYVVESAGRVILIDTGIGNAKHRPHVAAFNQLDTPFLDALGWVVGDASAVDLVVCTHLHQDHVGWNTTLRGGEWVPTFPNASYLLPEADFEVLDAVRREPGLHAEAFLDSVRPVVERGQAQLYSGEHRIDANLEIVPTPGHSPGTSVVRLSSGASEALFAGDLAHTPMQLTHPDQSSCFDEDPVAAAASRQRIFTLAADLAATVFTAHLPADAAPVLERDGDRVRIARWVELTH